MKTLEKLLQGDDYTTDGLLDYPYFNDCSRSK